MADRNPNFQMTSHNFTAAMLQQQQQQQQQLSQQQQQQSQLSSQVDSQSVPGFTNAEHGRMWQMQQMQNSYRTQQGGDMVSSQSMMDLMRSQNLARVQGQHQISQQQQFGLGPSPMGATNPSQPLFHDSQPSQQSIQNNFGGMSSIPPQFQNVGNRSAMIQALQNNQGNMSRQLELINLAQNQQPFAPRMAQQQQQHPHPQSNSNVQQGLTASISNDSFSSPAIPSATETMHNSTSHGSAPSTGLMGANSHPGVNQNGGVLPGRRPLTFPELGERATQLQHHIRTLEQDGAQFSAQRGNMPETAFYTKMTQIHGELKNKKDMLAKMLQAMAQMRHNMANAQGGNPGSGGGPSGQPLQQNVQGLSAPAWSQSGSSQPQGFGNPHGTPQMSNHAQAHPSNIQPSPSPLHAQANHMPQQNLTVTRTGGTPHLPNSISPNMGNQFPFQSPGAPGTSTNMQTPAQYMPMPPPLEKARFDSAYNSYCSSKGIKHDPRLMSVDSRSIDLHSLHVHVMREGGAVKANQNERWAVIGGRMGFVQFPGTETEPAKSGPGVAQHLAHVYKEYLQIFDGVYINSVIESKRKLQAAANQAQPQNNGAGPSSAPQNPQQSVRNLTVQQMTMLLQYCNMSVAELRARNVPEKTIQIVESNRISLQRTAAQPNLREMLAKQRAAEQLQQQQQSNQFTQSLMQNMANQQQQNPPPGNLPMSARPPQMNGANPTVGPPMDNSGKTSFPPRPQSTTMNANGSLPPNRPMRPTQEQLQHAVQFIARAKQDFSTRSMSTLRALPQGIPNDKRLEYNATLEQLHHYALEVDSKLPMYFVILKQEESIRKLIAIILTAQQQRSLLSSGNPRYIMDLRTLQVMVQQMQSANETFTGIIQSMMMNGNHMPPNAPPSNGQPPLPQPVHNIPQSRPQPVPSAPPQQQIPPASSAQITPPVNRQVSLSNHSKKKSQSASGQAGPAHSPSAAVSTPPSASTPVTNAPTPAHAASSPQTPKSPKTKATPKPKAAVPKRRPSKAVPPPPPPASIPTPPGGNKRPREEELSTEAAAGPSNAESPPKKPKTESEWDGPPSDILVKKEQDIENVKTEDDASTFLKQMTELIQLADAEGQESLKFDISQALDVLLKGYGSVPDVADSDVSSMSLLGDPFDLRSSSPSIKLAEEIFDFSSFTNLEEEESKPPTPELVSSSTGPSPESGSEADHAASAAASRVLKNPDLNKLKEEPTESLDYLRLGIWKEVDGGESAYYQADNWKWDGHMPTSEPPWAIFTS